MTYNSHCSGFLSTFEKNSERDSLWVADLAARLAFAFYNQVLCPIDFTPKEGRLNWFSFCQRFDKTNWDFITVLDTISQYYQRNRARVPQILLLVDELMKVPIHERQLNPNAPQQTLDKNPALLEILYQLHTVRSKAIDVVVSSLEPDAFKTYEGHFGNKLRFLSLPVVSTKDVFNLMMETLKNENEAAAKMCMMLAQFAGPIPLQRGHFGSHVSAL